MVAETLHPADFPRLERFNVVLVSGPQRSGTNFVTAAISEDTSLDYIPEAMFQSTWAQKWWAFVQTAESVVIHCPGMCRYLHMFGPFDEVAVVVVRRDVEDIIASQERIGWQWEPYELMLYDKHPHDGPIAVVKYDLWERVQQGLIRNAYEVEYESMSAHRMWVPKAQRVNFAKRQVWPDGVPANA